MQVPIDEAVEIEQAEALAAGSPPLGERKSVWQNRDFLILWSGQVTSVLGGQMAGLAYPLLLLALTHSTAQAGLVPVFWTAPFVVFGLPAGALVDRWNRKTVMLICNSFRMVAVLGLPLAYFTHHLTAPLVFLAAFGEGIGFCFFNIAEVSALPQIVSKQQLPDAMAMNEAGYAATSTVGPGVAGALIGAMKTQIAGTMLVFIAYGASYIATLVSLASMKTPFQQDRSELPQTTIHEDVKEGLAFIWNHKPIRTLAFWGAWMALIFGPMQLAVIVMVHHIFHHGPGTIGLIFSAGGVGGIIGAALAPKVKQKFAFGPMLIVIVALQGVVTFFEATAPNLIILAIMQMLLQLGNPMWNVAQMTYRLLVIPDHLQGRVNACYRLLVFAAFPLGSAIGGILLEHTSPRLLIGFMAIGTLAGAAVIYGTQLRRIKA